MKYYFGASTSFESKCISLQLIFFTSLFAQTSYAFTVNQSHDSLWSTRITPSSSTLLFNVPRPDDKESVKLGIKPSDQSLSSRFQEQFIEPLQGNIDSLTGGWALSYADLTPDSEQTAPGQAFLATNIAYAVAGAIITFGLGDFWLGICTELCAFASFNYHYYQLLAKGQEKADNVRLALLVDYLFAGASILTGFWYLFAVLPAQIPIEALLVTSTGVAFLFASWKWEYGRPYMFLHGMWHLFSAAGGYLIADAYSAASSSSLSV